MNPSPRSILQARFRLEAFRYPQEEIIQAILNDKDALVIMPTGGGKSLCYQLPALLRPGVTLVVSPLIALMKDQVDGLKAKGIAAAMINSSQSWPQQRQTLRELKENKLKLLYIAPERFRAGSFTDSLEGIPISLFAVDEAPLHFPVGARFSARLPSVGICLEVVGESTLRRLYRYGHPESGRYLQTPSPGISRIVRVRVCPPQPDFYPSQTQDQIAEIRPVSAGS